MGLLQETNQEYYVGQKVFYILPLTTLSAGNLVTSFNTELLDTVLNTINTNYILETSTDGGVIWSEYSGNYNVLADTTNTVEFDTDIVNVSPTITWLVRVRILPPALYDNYGSYEYISLNNIINNFLLAYVGKDKIIPSAKRTDILFHAKRGLQEFSYDTLKSIKSQELTIPPSLSVIIPQDYVNYVKCSWVDSVGAKHIIYPTRVTSNPTELPVQDSDGIPTQDEFGENEQAATSTTDDRWAAQDNSAYEDFTDYRYPEGQYMYGQRYGLQPEEAQINGKFTINERLGKFSFSSSLTGKIIILEYISDGLATDLETKVPKLAEEAMYMHIAHGILSGRMNVPEYIIARFKKDRRAALRNAKIRLSNIKIEEITQVFRNKSKLIKH